MKKNLSMYSDKEISFASLSRKEHPLHSVFFKGKKDYIHVTEHSPRTKNNRKIPQKKHVEMF